MMKKNLLLIVSLFSIVAAGQAINPYALVYKPDLEALKIYAQEGNDEPLLSSVQVTQPIDTLWLDSDSNQLPEQRGVYMLVYTANDRLTFSLLNQKPWPVFLNNEKSRISMRVYNDSTQTFISNADVYESRKGNINFDTKEQAYIFTKRFNRYGKIVIVNNGVPMWVDWDATEYRGQGWYGFKYRIRSFWLRLTDRYYRQEAKEYRKRYKLLGKNMSYIATNKPLYRVGDTLKLKAFILNKKLSGTTSALKN